MVGGNNNNNNNAKSSTHKPPTSSSAPTAANSSSHNPKSRWPSTNNNDGGSSSTTKNNNNKPTVDHKITDKKLLKSNPPKIASVPIQSHPNKPNLLTSSSSRPPPPGSALPAPPFPFPDSSAALGAPPPPTYGFHLLERRNIALADGTVRSYFALPPNYQDFPPPPPLPPAGNRFIGPEFGRFPPFHPEEFRDQQNHWDRDRPEGSMKRKYQGEEEIDRRDERGEMLRHRHQLMQYGNPNVGEDVRVAKHMRIGSSSSRHESGGGQQGVKSLQVDEIAIKKSFMGYVKRVFEEPAERKNYLENGRKGGRLQCLVCGRFDGFLQSIYRVCFFGSV